MTTSIILGLLFATILIAFWRKNRVLMVTSSIALLVIVLVQLFTIEFYFRYLVDHPTPEDFDARSYLHGAKHYMRYIQELRPYILVEVFLLFLASILCAGKKTGE